MTRQRRDLNLITVFLEVFRLQSITLAAESLDLTQPAVSSALKRFRDQIGSDLFVRDGRGIAPTSTAVQLANELAPALSSIDRTLGNLGEFDVDTPRTFKVFITEPMAYLLQPHFERNPDLGSCKIEFELAPNSTDDMLKALSTQRVDLAIDISNESYHSYNRDFFHEDEFVLVCSRSHPRIRGEVDLEQFLDEEHVALRFRRSGSRPLEFFIREKSFQRNIVFECESPLSILAFVGNGQLLGITPRSLASVFAEKFELQVLELPFETKPVVHSLISHKKLDHSPAHKWLKNTLATSVKAL